ncbi:hypothetical protein [Streptomyces sp. NRRL F-5630]|uniref:hypothetical protein n=1 Tax=Streptomyces sp. NRRL F-5630 TaxID=1463864 RepID=UPI003D725EF9
MNRQHTRTYTRRIRLGLPAATLGLAAAAVATAWSPAQAAETTPPVPGAGQRAHARLAGLTLAPVAPLGIGPFDGTYGIADAPRAGAPDNGDFTDPDGVLRYLTVTGRKVARAADAGARAQVPGVSLRLGGTEWAAVRPEAGPLDTYAECTPPPQGPSARAYARAGAWQAEVLGHPVPRGTTTLQVTGAELKHPSTIGTGTLTVTYEEYRQPLDGGPERAHAARAGVRMRVTGTLRSVRGDIAYQGQILDLRLGEVTADCAPTTSPAPVPAPAGGSPTHALTGPASPTPVSSPTPTHAPSRSAVPPAPGAPAAMGGTATGALPGGPGLLVGTGTPLAMWLIGLSATLVVGGTGLVLRARRDIRS